MYTVGYFLIGIILAEIWLKNQNLKKWSGFVDWWVTVCLWPILIVKMFKP